MIQGIIAMYRLSRRRALLGSLTLLAGCEQGASVAPPNTPAVAAAFPAVGSTWTVRVTNSASNRTYEMELTAITTTYHGKPAYAFSAPGFLEVYDPETFNFKAVLVNDQEKAAYDPDFGNFSWPLWVGKSWTSTMKVKGDIADYFSVHRKVVALEKISVPAGDYDAYRIELYPGANMDPGLKETVWYAPSVRLPVKTIFNRSAQAEAGRAVITIELVTPPAR